MTTEADQEALEHQVLREAALEQPEQGTLELQLQVQPVIPTIPVLVTHQELEQVMETLQVRGLVRPGQVAPPDQGTDQPVDPDQLVDREVRRVLEPEAPLTDKQ